MSRSVRFEDYDPVADAALPQYDHTALAGVNTCPVFGIIRYVHHKTLAAGSARSLPLECGTACHEAFAAERLHRVGWNMGLRDHADVHGVRIFGHERWDHIRREAKDVDQTLDGINMAYVALQTSGYYDDPNDKRRTLSNMEEALHAYCDRIDPERRIWIGDRKDPEAMIGVENPFILKVTLDGTHCGRAFQERFAFTGRIDGIEIDDRFGIVTEDNKTTSRITDAWEDAMGMSHQFTGYIQATAHFVRKYGMEASKQRAWVRGLAIPIPKSDAPTRDVPVMRDQAWLDKWIVWAYTTAAVIRKYEHVVDEAPMYTHSCGRYFRPCQFIPHCDAPEDERVEMREREMIVQRWSPLAEEDPA